MVTLSRPGGAASGVADRRKPGSNFRVRVLASGLRQFPESFRWEPERLDSFFSLLPRTIEEAAHLARKHDARVEGRAFLKPRTDGPLRHAVEVRSETFRAPEFPALLREHRVALVIADTAGRWLELDDVTSDFVYIRLHGDEELYASGYGEEALRRWAARIAAFRVGKPPEEAMRRTGTRATPRSPRDVYVYFDNDRKVRAPFDALALVDALENRRPSCSGSGYAARS